VAVFELPAGAISVNEIRLARAIREPVFDFGARTHLDNSYAAHCDPFTTPLIASIKEMEVKPKWTQKTSRPAL